MRRLFRRVLNICALNDPSLARLSEQLIGQECDRCAIRSWHAQKVKGIATLFIPMEQPFSLRRIA
jgi:hypothetical protein